MTSAVITENITTVQVLEDVITVQAPENTITVTTSPGVSSDTLSADIATHAARINGVHGLTTNISAALSGAASPSAANVFATMADAGGGGVQLDDANIWTAGQSFRAESIYQKAALATGSFTAFSIDPQDTSARDWNFNIGVAANATLPRNNVIMNWGYNNGADGGAAEADAALYLQLESYYELQTGVPFFEYHLDYYNGAANYRPFQININQSTHAITHYYYADSWTLYDKTGTVYATFTLTNTPTTSGGTFNFPITVQSTANQIQLIAKASAGQSASIQEWQASDGAAVLSISPAGKLTMTGQLSSAWTTVATADTQGVLFNWTVDPAAAGGNYSAIYGAALHTNAQTITSLYGLNFLVSQQGSGTISAATGVSASIASTAGCGITSAIGIDSTLTLRASGSTAYGFRSTLNFYTAATTLSNYYGAFISTPTSSGTITNSYGMYISEQQPSGVTYGTGLYIAAQTGYAIVSGGGASIHTGNMKIGAFAYPGYPVDAGGDINAQAGVYRVSGTQVVGARVIDARADDVANSGDATTDGLIDALRDAMIAHGLIAAA